MVSADSSNAVSARPETAAPAALFGPLSPGRPLSWREAVAYFVAGAAGVTAIGLRCFPQVLAGDLVNPDSYMRLVRLQEIIERHAAINVVSRDASGSGSLLHWSHLLDSLLLLLAAPLTLFLDQKAALHAVALGFGPLAFGLLIVVLGWAVAPLTQPRWRWLLPLIALLSPALDGVGAPGVLRHNILALVTCGMAAGWALRVPLLPGSAGLAIGGWAAAGIWLDPETMPFLIGIFGAVGLFWVCAPEAPGTGGALRIAGTTFLVLLAAALIADPPPDGYRIAQLDRMSLLHGALAAVTCVVGWTLWWLDRSRLEGARRSLAGIAVALLGFGVWAAAFPAALAGPHALLNPDEASVYFGFNPEMQPIVTPGAVIGYLMDALLASAACFVIAVRARSPVWALAGVYACLTVALGASLMRFAIYPALAGAAALPVIMSGFDQSIATSRSAAVAASQWIVLFLYLLAPESLGFANLVARDQVATAALAGRSCDDRQLKTLLRPYAGQVVLADPADTVTLLYRTQVLTAGSLYHRNIDAFLAMRDAWRSPASDDVPSAFRRTRASLVLVCTRSARSALVADLPSGTLFDQLQEEHPPPWLVLVSSDAASGYRLYRVVEPAGAR
jgi:hypothetical protein